MAMRRFLVLLAGLSVGATAHAAFVDWWLTPDQQGRLQFERGEYQQAARLFEDPLWKGLAFYASGDFESAANWLAQIDTAYALFCLGNAYAHMDRLRESLDAYDAALAMQPDFAEAQFNRDWVGGLYELSQREYDDYGGTGGKLGADDFVISDRADNAQQTMTAEEAVSQGLSDEQIEQLWMRRVQTTPGDFLAYKFSFQAQRQAEQ